MRTDAAVVPYTVYGWKAKVGVFIVASLRNNGEDNDQVKSSFG